jgi:exopolysaccharide biosynthesis polyprenyl glycosylphosphotransferase
VANSPLVPTLAPEERARVDINDLLVHNDRGEGTHRTSTRTVARVGVATEPVLRTERRRAQTANVDHERRSQAAAPTVVAEQPAPLDSLALDLPYDAAFTEIDEPAPLRRRLRSFDIAAIGAVWGVGAIVRMPGGTPGRLHEVVLETVLVLGVTLVALNVLQLYRARICSVRRVARRRLTLAAAIGGSAAWLLELAQGYVPSTISMVASAAALAMALIVAREIFEQWLRSSRVRGHYQRPVLVVGTLAETEKIVGLLEAHPETGCRAVAWLGEFSAPSASSSSSSMVTVPWIGPLESVTDAVGLTEAMGVLVGPSVAAGPELPSLVRELHAVQTHVQLWTGLWNVDHRRLHAAPIAHEPFFYLEPTNPGSAKLWVKRALDLVLSSLILVVTAPIMLAVAIAIKVDDGGPVFFRQERVGLGGRRFMIRKFRTMGVDAEAQLADLREQNERNGPLFKLESDPRVTRIGKMLRFTSIDELPQLIDVLSGHLSLVGPRPALPNEVAEFDDELRQRHRVVPGVTGLWQVEARHNPSFYAYRHLDLFYVDNWTLGLDMVILMATAKTVLSDGAHELWAMVDRHRKASH